MKSEENYDTQSNLMTKTTGAIMQLVEYNRLDRG